jgi:hypothetical protein
MLLTSEQQYKLLAGEQHEVLLTSEQQYKLLAWEQQDVLQGLSSMSDQRLPRQGRCQPN